MSSKFYFHPTGSATAELFVPGHSPITVIGTEAIRNTFDDATLQQVVNARCCPGITNVVLTPDAHVGYGAPVGCVMVSPDHVYPGPVGVDIKCSMSLLQFDLPEEAMIEKPIRRVLINAIAARTPTGYGRGQRNVSKGCRFNLKTIEQALTQGASKEVCYKMGIPPHWAERCEDAFHRGHDHASDSLVARLQKIRNEPFLNKFEEKMEQLGSYGGGNHFGECEITKITDNDQARHAAACFGLRDRCVSFLSHCGSRGFGNLLATSQFRSMRERFKQRETPFPAGDYLLAYANIGSSAANDYWDDMALAANFATVNHLIINTLILKAFEEVFPGVKAEFVYLISHNIARWEIWQGQAVLVHRKGATRAFPAGHCGLKGTPFETIGHPILLPGNPVSGSAVMVALPGAEKTCYSVNHGAGRQLARGNAKRSLNQQAINKVFDKADILFNGRDYPKDEAPVAYKDFDEVLRSVVDAELAVEVARLHARFVIKDGDKADD